MKNKNYVVNLGCRLNIYEGEIIKNHLKTNNLNNVTVINSCAVTEEAEKKVSYEIRKAKKNFPNNKIVVTGCAAQINPLKYKDAKLIKNISYSEAINKNLKVMDLTAISLAKDTKIPIFVTSIFKENSLINVLNRKGSYSKIS